MHLVDGTQDDPVAAYRTVRGELEAYGNGLAEKPEIVAMTKSDALDEETISIVLSLLQEETDRPIHVISAVSREGLDPLLTALLDQVDASRADRDQVEQAEPGRGMAWSPH